MYRMYDHTTDVEGYVAMMWIDVDWPVDVTGGPIRE
jgi:hypothetical protein